MNRGTIHAARSGLTGDHRTDGIRCGCDPWILADINEPGRAVVVHRPSPTAAALARDACSGPAGSLAAIQPGREDGKGTALASRLSHPPEEPR